MDDRGRERFGRYEILTELGRGAMGVVYKARDPKINRVVAVKTVSLAGQPLEDEIEYRERFIREAEAAGRLSHPGIVTIFDVGEEPETRSPYIVMEFVGGHSLDAFLSQHDHKLPVEVALQLTLELAEALDCAHGQGVVHRDLKPANILLTEDGLFTVYASLGGDAGFGSAQQVRPGWDEEKGPSVVLSDGTQTIFTADMSGDGLSDIVRVKVDRRRRLVHPPRLQFLQAVLGELLVSLPWAVVVSSHVGFTLLRR